jgi:hypothetical protein
LCHSTTHTNSPCTENSTHYYQTTQISS